VAVDYSTHFARQLIGEVLVEMGVTDAAGIEAGLEVQSEKGGRLGEILCFLDLIKEADVAKALGQQLGLPFEEALDADEIDPQLVSKMSLSWARQNGILPIEKFEDRGGGSS
jgi:general secretion pathway protein E